MAKDKNGNKQENAEVAGALMTADETKALLQTTISDESLILDGAAILSDVLSGKDVDARLERVVKLVGSEQNMNPGITGIFQGYEPVLVRRPGAGPDEPKQLMSFALFEVRKGFIAKLLATSQIVQGLGSTPIGTVVSVIRPHVKNSDGSIEPEYVGIGGARRVGIFHVINRNKRAAGSAIPYGELGKQLMAQNAAKALAPGEPQEVTDATTGEVVNAR